MVVRPMMPLPFQRMLEHLNIDAESSFKRLPEKTRDAVQRCLICKFFHNCDYDSESRYFRCPNRDFLDQLEYLRDDDNGGSRFSG